MRHIRLLAIALLSTSIILCNTARAELRGKVVGISDGDTFTILTKEKKQIKIRLHGIDCPEKAQDYGQVAKKFTSDLIYEKNLTVKETDVDRYGRTIGIAYLPDGQILNEKLLKAGLAWHYTQYDSNAAWSKLEAKARKNKVGLWKLDNAIAPWKWRELKNHSKVNINSKSSNYYAH